MEIKGINGALRAYNVQKQTKPVSKEKVSSVRSSNLDRIEFDFSRSLDAAKANIASELNSDATPQVIDTTKAQLENGELDLSSNDLASIIVSF